VLKNPGSPIGPGLSLQDIVLGSFISGGKVNVTKILYNVSNHPNIKVPSASVPGIHPQATTQHISKQLGQKFKTLRPRYVDEKELKLKELCKDINKEMNW